MPRKGIALILSLLVITVLLILSTAILSKTIAEQRLTERYVRSTEAFWLAEAGVNRALYELRQNGFDVAEGTDVWSDTTSKGNYSIDIGPVVGDDRTVITYGYTPIADTQMMRTIEVLMTKRLPPKFFGSAIYSAKDVDLNGKSYSIEGDVVYAGNVDGDTSNINGELIHDPTVSPLPMLDFDQLHILSAMQGNVWDAERLQLMQLERSLPADQQTNTMPSSFWYQEPTDPTDPSTGIPNIVYVESDFPLNGNVGTIGGFIVVVGDIITDPDITDDIIINGCGDIDGVIYTRGVFRVNGGGSAELNVNGGVICGELGRLNGDANIIYNDFYMQALRDLNLGVEPRLANWKDKNPPYPLTP